MSSILICTTCKGIGYKTWFGLFKQKCHSCKGIGRIKTQSRYTNV